MCTAGRAGQPSRQYSWRHLAAAMANKAAQAMLGWPERLMYLYSQLL